MAVLWNVWPINAGSRVVPPRNSTASGKDELEPKCSPTDVQPMRPNARPIVSPYAYPSRFDHRTARVHLRNVGNPMMTAAMNPPENCRPPFQTAMRSRGELIWFVCDRSHVMRAPITPPTTNRVASRY